MPSKLFAKVRRVDMGTVTEIRCQHPDCRSHPKLRIIYYVEDNIPIGSCCLKKGMWRVKERSLEEF